MQLRFIMDSLLMSMDGIRTYDIKLRLSEFGDIVCESRYIGKLCRTHEGEIRRIEEKYRPLIFPIIGVARRDSIVLGIVVIIFESIDSMGDHITKRII